MRIDPVFAATILQLEKSPVLDFPRPPDIFVLFYEHHLKLGIY